MTMLMLSIYLPSVPTALADVVPREEIIWGCGFWPDLTDFNPIKMNDGMGWDTYVTYEPLFGTDVAGGQLINWLGESIRWVDSLTIEVKLRAGIYWVKLTDAGPEYYRPITTEDVKYSYLLTGAFDESNENAYWMDGFKTRVGSMDNFEIVNDRVFRVHITSGYENSEVVYRTMIRGFLIVPWEGVWEEIDPDPADGDYLMFANDWLAGGFNPDWKVASGMYLPWWRNDLLTQTILKKNDNWWGITVLGKQPAPKYMGYIRGYSNVDLKAWVSDGSIDWDGDYIEAIWDKTAYPYSNTYFANPPYFADALTLLMVPNHLRYPLNEPWLHWAIALVMDYPSISAIASGYSVDGSVYPPNNIQYPNAFLIPKDDAIGNELLKGYPNKATYLISRNVANALGIIQANCVDATGGTWTKGEDAYTKGTSAALAAWAQNLEDYYGDIELTVGTVTRNASVWLAGGFGDADELTGVDGINVKLGPWTIIDVDGWTDVCAKDGVVANLVTKDLGISLTSTPLAGNGYDVAMDANDYDFADYCMSWGLNGNLYERYMQFFWGTYSGEWNHYGSYVNTALEAKIESLDTAPDKQAVANQIFDIVGTDLPLIPMSGAPDWYIYSNKYWVRWPNEKHAFKSASPYGGAGQEANVLYILLSLGSVKMPTDLNNDHKVDIIDIATAAKAFGSYPGHPRWEFVADVNSDGKVDILDIARIAKNFGKIW